MKFLLFLSFVFFTVFSYSQVTKIVARKDCPVTESCPANSSGSGLVWTGITIYDWHDHDNNPSTLDTLGWSPCTKKTVTNSGIASVIKQDNCPCRSSTYTKTPANCRGQTSCRCVYNPPSPPPPLPPPYNPPPYIPPIFNPPIYNPPVPPPPPPPCTCTDPKCTPTGVHPNCGCDCPPPPCTCADPKCTPTGVYPNCDCDCGPDTPSECIPPCVGENCIGGEWPNCSCVCEPPPPPPEPCRDCGSGCTQTGSYEPNCNCVCVPPPPPPPPQPCRDCGAGCTQTGAYEPNCKCVCVPPPPPPPPPCTCDDPKCTPTGVHPNCGCSCPPEPCTCADPDCTPTGTPPDNCDCSCPVKRGCKPGRGKSGFLYCK